MRKKLLVMMVIGTCLLNTACSSMGSDISGTGEIVPEFFALPTEAEDSEVYVEKIAGLSEDFIRGVDVSEVISLEDSGVVFTDSEGNEQDVFKTLAQNGVNYVRIRVWNNPYDEKGNGYGGGNCDLDKAIAMGRRATKYGMKAFIDFHYSDFWADPTRQLAPKEWQDLSADEKMDAVYDYTMSSLEKLYECKVDVGMVQVGNETNFGMAGETNTEITAKLIGAGARAVRDFSAEKEKNVKIAVHYTNATNKDQITGLLDSLKKNDVDYDVVGLSYYLYWHGSMGKLSEVMETIQSNYGKEVMIAEFSYPYTLEAGDSSSNSVAEEMLVEPYEASVQGQSKLIHDMCELANNAGGIGVFYWGGTWINVPANSDKEESELWEEFGSGWATKAASVYDPENVGNTYGGNGWENQALFDFNGKALDSLSTFKYIYTGTNCSKPEGYDDKPVDKSMILANSDVDNLVVNPSFEEVDTSMWTVNFEGDKNPTDYQDNEQDAYSGTKAFHYWSEDDMNFTILQTVDNLEEGEYTLSVYSQGGDFTSDSSLQLFAVADGDVFYSEEFQNNGWVNWQNPTITNIKVSEWQSITFGVIVNCNAKAWGTLDDFCLYKQ